MKRIAFVVQRCGQEVNGGAELQARILAEKLSERLPVDVLTTCAKDYFDWANHYPEGEESCGGATIRRFRVDQRRNMRVFDGYSRYLNFRRKFFPLTQLEEAFWMRLQGPRSSGLTRYIEAHKDRYDAFVFFTYLYATTYDNLPLVADKAWLFPEAHDEWAMGLTIFRGVFASARGFFFNTRVEQGFLQQRFPEIAFQGPIIGLGVDPPARSSEGDFRERYGIDKPFLLYIGRVDQNKGCDKLLEFFLEFSKNKDTSGGAPFALVFLGQVGMETPAHPDAHFLGFVDERTKWEALAACDWLINPSEYESLSIVLLEAWACGKPTLANARCAVLVDQTHRSGAGLTYANPAELTRILVETSAEERKNFGEQGKRFVEQEYAWPRLVDAMLKELGAA